MSTAPAFSLATPSIERFGQSQWSSVTFLDAIAPWVLETLSRIEELKGLGDNWDGYGSPRIQPATLAQARRLAVSVGMQELPAPFVSPVSGGAIGFHWRVGRRELELTVLPNEQIEYLKVLDQDLEREDAMQAGVLPPNRGSEVGTMLNWLIAL